MPARSARLQTSIRQSRIPSRSQYRIAGHLTVDPVTMFSRAAVNPMEEAVTKATDENLTTENWESILGVCDKVDADHEGGAHNAIAAIQKRLGHRNANVQLFSLSVSEWHLLGVLCLTWLVSRGVVEELWFESASRDCL